MNDIISTDLAAYTLRVQGFLNRGYRLRFRYDLPNVLFSKLCGKKGQYVSIVYHKDDGRISMLKNNA